MSICNVTVIIPTYQRSDQLLKALNHIHQCEPQPAEIIVHVDGGDTDTEVALLKSEFQEIVIKSSQQVGPGGGRNRAIAAAKYPIVASFDDDSYPIDSDYFARLLKLFETFPKAAVIGARIYHRDEAIESDGLTARWVSSFIGCGCAYRKAVFQQTSGYVQLPIAYGMEEVDLSLRLHDLGWAVLESDWLRVFHDTQLTHHSHPKITAASIANQMLLTYLRYPILFWWLGIVQCISRISWLIHHGRFSGTLDGLIEIPKLIRGYQADRQPVSVKSLISYQKLRRQTISTSPTILLQKEVT